MYRCTVIGISDSHEQWFAPDVRKVIESGRVFSGGKRHHEIMHDFIPDNAVWIDITVPLNNVFEQYRQYDDIVIFASGDPLFYGFANTVQRECPGVEMKVFPAFNSLQSLAHRLNLPYHDMKMVSQTGRPWLPLDEAVISGERLIGVLTDRNKTPQQIAARMVDYGYDNYEVTVGECLGNESSERIRSYRTVGELAGEPHIFAVPNCMIMQRTSERKRPLGIPESEFSLLNGRTKMITKMPVRLLSLSMLDLRSRSSFWDVGFCTGSVSVEAKLQFPHLSITAFEVREEGLQLISENSRKFGTPGIEPVIGDFMQSDLSLYPRPDAVFIGGHGGQLKEMILRLRTVMNPGCVLVFNSVSEESRMMFEEGVREAGMSVVQQTHVTIDDFNPIYIMKAI